MPRSPEAAALEAVRDALRNLLGKAEIDGIQEGAKAKGRQRVDLLFRALGATFAVEWKAAGDAANVGGAIRQLVALKKATDRRSKPLVAIVAVPFMGETGRRLCADVGLSWIDLSGNTWIDAPGRQIRILGNANRFSARGRPANVFAPRSSRLIRALLLAPRRSFSQAELASITGVDKGRVSRLVRRLQVMDLVEPTNVDRIVRIRHPGLALDAWREAYDFWKHDVLQGHIAARGPEELVARVAKAKDAAPSGWALTGLAAAWHLTHFALFRLTTLFVRERASSGWLAEIGFREEARGANVWIVRPVDDGVFEGMSSIDGVPCVHPLQAYLDLKAQPERAQEAAAELRGRHLTWSEA